MFWTRGQWGTNLSPGQGFTYYTDKTFLEYFLFILYESLCTLSSTPSGFWHQPRIKFTQELLFREFVESGRLITRNVLTSEIFSRISRKTVHSASYRLVWSWPGTRKSQVPSPKYQICWHDLGDPGWWDFTPCLINPESHKILEVLSQNTSAVSRLISYLFFTFAVGLLVNNQNVNLSRVSVRERWKDLNSDFIDLSNSRNELLHRLPCIKINLYAEVAWHVEKRFTNRGPLGA